MSEIVTTNFDGRAVRPAFDGRTAGGVWWDSDGRPLLTVGEFWSGQVALGNGTQWEIFAAVGEHRVYLGVRGFFTSFEYPSLASTVNSKLHLNNEADAANLADFINALRWGDAPAVGGYYRELCRER